MNVYKSTYDVIPLRIFKICPDTVLSQLVELLNSCIKEGIMPNTLKISEIIPIHKKGSRFQVNNYRPISLLSYIDKILEKAMHRRLNNHLNKINFFCPNQFGFREHHSTEHAILSLLERAYHALEVKEWTMLITIDFQKAFDVIRHDILLYKLFHIGIKGVIWKWFESYLKDRTHRTLVNGVLSQPLITKTGIPQGSSLGPLLFLIYINDLKNIFLNNEINIFADDSALILSCKQIDQLFNLANRKMFLLMNYLKANGIKLNENKTEYMIISPNRSVPIHNMNLAYNNFVIKEVESIKLLGVHFDNKLSFSCHTQTLIARKLRMFVPILLKLRKFLPVGHLLKIYHANINSLISYCLIAYHAGNSTNITKIRGIQQRILKVIFAVRSHDLQKHMIEHGLLDVSDTYIYKILCIGHKMVYNPFSLPIFLRSIYRNKIDSNLRNNKDFIVPYHRLTIGQNSLDHRVAVVWNKLPKEIKDITRYSLFVKQAKRLLISGFFKEVIT